MSLLSLYISTYLSMILPTFTCRDLPGRSAMFICKVQFFFQLILFTSDLALIFHPEVAIIHSPMPLSSQALPSFHSQCINLSWMYYKCPCVLFLDLPRGVLFLENPITQLSIRHEYKQFSFPSVLYEAESLCKQS